MKKLHLQLTCLLFISMVGVSCSNDTTATPAGSDVQSRVKITNPVDVAAVNVTIGSQIWMKKNLNVSRYRNGDVIPQVTDPVQWANLTTGAWCYNTNLSSNGAVYGKLYNWYAVNDPRGLAPVGYHIPSTPEWLVLMQTLGGINYSAGKMKATTLWKYPNTGATNESGFTALPGGNRHEDGSFVETGYNGFWWHTTIDALDAPNIEGVFYNSALGYDWFYSKKGGLSVRCIKD